MTSAVHICLAALKKTWHLKRMLLFLFSANVLFALAVALPINFLLKNRVSHSYLFAQSIGDFNFSFIGDMMNNKGAELMMLINQSYWVFFMYLLLSILFLGGIIEHLVRQHERFNPYVFLEKGLRCFWRYLRLSILFIILQGLLLVLIWSLFQYILHGLSPFNLDSDSQLIRTFYWLAPMYLIIASILLMIQDYAKMYVFNSDGKFVLPSIWKAIKYCGKNFIKCYFLYFLFILLLLAAYVLYQVITSIIPTTSLVLIAIIFLLSQIFIFFRIWIRVANLSGVDLMVNGHSKNDIAYGTN